MKKTRIKKISMAIMALLALTIIPLTAFANEEAITGPQPQTGNLFVHKYAVSSPADVAAPGDGTLISDQDFFEGKKPLEGIAFTAIKVNPVVNSENGSYYYPEDANDEYYLTAAATEGNTGGVVLTNAAGTAEFNSLPQGVYLVKETASVDADGVVYAPVAPFLVQVPMTNPDGNGWMEDVHVYPKNLDMTPEKTAEGAGESGKNPETDKTVNWAINVQIPSDLENTTIIRITDKINFHLSYNAESLVVSTIAAKDAVSGTILTKTTHYTVEHTYKTVTDPETSDVEVTENSLVVELTEAGIEELKDRFATEPYIRVAFSTDLTESALGLIISNGAEYEFGNDEDHLIQSELDPEDPDAPQAYTGAISISKANPSSEPLKGAVFAVASSEANAKNGVYMNGLDGNPITAVTDENGVAILKGIAYGGAGESAADATIHGDKKFYLVEIQAPEGYNILENPVEVGFSYEKVENADGTYTNFFNNGATFKIINSKGFTLPGTGSAGIVLSTIAGIALLGGVIIFATFRKAKKIKK